MLVSDRTSEEDRPMLRIFALLLFPFSFLLYFIDDTTNLPEYIGLSFDANTGGVLLAIICSSLLEGEPAHDITLC